MVLSAPAAVLPTVGAALVAPATPHMQHHVQHPGGTLANTGQQARQGANTHAQQQAGQLASPVLPLSITGVSIQNGQLVSQGLLGANPFTAPLTLSTSPSADPSTSILNLHLDPIHLNLLGLKVDTSPICLAITAQSGSGNLLGNLVSDVAHLLDQGTPLGTILSGLTSDQQSLLTGSLSSLLSNVANDITAPSSVGTPAASTAGTTNILHLSVGPLNLNLLGLDVRLDNCSNGPVTVDVSAQSGPGNLLGNLLTDVAGLLDNTHLSTRAIDTLLTQLADDALTIV